MFLRQSNNMVLKTAQIQIQPMIGQTWVRLAPVHPAHDFPCSPLGHVWSRKIEKVDEKIPYLLFLFGWMLQYFEGISRPLFG